MKHMGTNKVFVRLGTVVVALGIGASGYYLGEHSNQVRTPETRVEHVKSVSHKKSSSLSSSVDSSYMITVDDTDSSVSSSSSSKVSSNTTNGSLIDSANNTFAGFHDVHELANNGYTVTSYLIDHEGMTPEQAHNYVRNHFDFLYNNNFLTSGEIQTKYEADRSSLNN